MKSVLKNDRLSVAAMVILLGWIAVPYAWAQIDAAQATSAQGQKDPSSKENSDPFSDLAAPVPSEDKTAEEVRPSWMRRFLKENFGFRKEIMSQFNVSDGNGASRQSVGFEVLKKFSTETSTVASFDFQARLVRRDGYNPVLNDMEGASRPGWAFEYHNLYLDFYNVLNPFLSEYGRRNKLGKFNFRAGRFYVPFGLNLQTDTHGTVLQLSNEENFGFERDWYTGFWGGLNKHVNYDLYYLAGSGYDLKYKGQSGLGALRLSLANKYSSQYGLEGGFSLMGGERLSSAMNDRTDVGSMGPSHIVETRRAGLDGRYRHAIPTGLLTFTSELSAGKDLPNAVFTQLYQAEYLRASRRWGAATQYRRFRANERGVDGYIIGEFTYYFRNDVGNSNLHWIKLNVQRQFESNIGRPNTIVTLQYYFYR